MRGARDEFIRIIFEMLYFLVRKTISVFIAFITFTNERYKVRSYEYIKNNFCHYSVFKYRTYSCKNLTISSIFVTHIQSWFFSAHFHFRIVIYRIDRFKAVQYELGFFALTCVFFIITSYRIKEKKREMLLSVARRKVFHWPTILNFVFNYISKWV